ncbi:hypothetical protein HDV00_007090 [Rhizophlyctis rosea]|nr:hypothetical protein HDV00_007090 [Rhizophlyctis rosea]
MVVLDNLDSLLVRDSDALCTLFEWSMKIGSRLNLVVIAKSMGLTAPFLRKLHAKKSMPQILQVQIESSASSVSPVKDIAHVKLLENRTVQDVVETGGSDDEGAHRATRPSVEFEKMEQQAAVMDAKPFVAPVVAAKGKERALDIEKVDDTKMEGDGGIARRWKGKGKVGSVEETPTSKPALVDLGRTKAEREASIRAKDSEISSLNDRSKNFNADGSSGFSTLNVETNGVRATLEERDKELSRLGERSIMETTALNEGVFVEASEKVLIANQLRILQDATTTLAGKTIVGNYENATNMDKKMETARPSSASSASSASSLQNPAWTPASSFTAVKSKSSTAAITSRLSMIPRSKTWTTEAREADDVPVRVNTQFGTRSDPSAANVNVREGGLEVEGNPVVRVLDGDGVTGAVRGGGSSVRAGGGVERKVGSVDERKEGEQTLPGMRKMNPNMCWRRTPPPVPQEQPIPQSTNQQKRKRGEVPEEEEVLRPGKKIVDLT